MRRSQFMRYSKSFMQPKVLTGTADIDISAADYTAYQTLLTITPTGRGLVDLRIALDLNKATTGWDTVSTAADTLDIALVSTVDGTNYRNIGNSAQFDANGDGSLEMSENGACFHVGPVDVNEVLIVKVKLNAERADAEIPYRISDVGATPTVTPVAAG